VRNWHKIPAVSPTKKRLTLKQMDIHIRNKHVKYPKTSDPGFNVNLITGRKTTDAIKNKSEIPLKKRLPIKYKNTLDKKSAPNVNH